MTSPCTIGTLRPTPTQRPQAPVKSPILPSASPVRPMGECVLAAAEAGEVLLSARREARVRGHCRPSSLFASGHRLSGARWRSGPPALRRTSMPAIDAHLRLIGFAAPSAGTCTAERFRLLGCAPLPRRRARAGRRNRATLMAPPCQGPAAPVRPTPRTAAGSIRLAVEGPNPFWHRVRPSDRHTLGETEKKAMAARLRTANVVAGRRRRILLSLLGCSPRAAMGPT